jgi:hypothetical protein
VGEGWAYYLLQYIYFPCKKFYIKKSLKKGKSPNLFFLSFSLSYLSLSLSLDTPRHRDCGRGPRPRARNTVK